MKAKLQAAAFILLIGAGYAGYLFYTFHDERIPAMEAERKKVEGEIVAKQGELKRLQSFAQNIETIKRELKELDLQFKSALEYMPRTYDLAKLLRKLTGVAQNSGVELFTFRPKKDGEDRKDGTFYSSKTIDFDIKGSFTQILVFLDQLSRLKRIVNIDTLRLKLGEGSTQRSGATLVAMQGVVRTYRFAE